MAEAPDAARPGLGDELRALALISLGVTELGGARFTEADQHLPDGQLDALVRLGQTEAAEPALAGLAEPERDRGEIRIAEAALRLAQDDPYAAAAALAPVLDGTAPVIWQTLLAQDLESPAWPTHQTR